MGWNTSLHTIKGSKICSQDQAEHLLQSPHHLRDGFVLIYSTAIKQRYSSDLRALYHTTTREHVAKAAETKGRQQNANMFKGNCSNLLGKKPQPSLSKGCMGSWP